MDEQNQIMRKIAMNNEFDLFNTDNQAKGSVGLQKLDVVKLDYVGAESITWEELFSGFSDIKAITFSSGVSFVGKLLEKFTTAEIIFGCEEVMSGTMQEVMAFQSLLIDRIRKSESKCFKLLVDRISKKTLRLYVSRNRLSHEKIYLLSSGDGRKRVVMGSANMSYNAFGGRQRENICFVDGDAAYDWYLSTFETLKNDSVDEITQKAINISNVTDNIDALPIAETIRVKKAIYIEPAQDVKEDVRFVLDVKKLSSKLASSIPAIVKSDKKTGRTLLVPDTVIKIKRQVLKEEEKEKILREEFPQLDVNIEDHKVFLNSKELDLNPTAEEIRSDVELFVRYMDGYSKFHGAWEDMQNRYFEFSNWFFCTPFMAVMRDIATQYDQSRLPYPVFGLLYGQSKAGKTTFLETLLKMMIGQKTKISAPDFTRKAIAELKMIVHGAPIIVDDLTQTRFSQHAVETIKWDDFGVDSHNISYPAVVISANEDVKAIAQEVTRRTVVCRVQAGLTNTEVMRSNVVRIVQQKLGTALYREYLRRMLDVVPNLIDEMKNEEAETAPDILGMSSQILVSIIQEYIKKLPSYVRVLSLESYFSEEVTGKYAIQVIQRSWKTSRKSFEVSVKNNELRYNAGTPYEVDRLLKELPETLEPRRSRDWLIVNLDSARNFFGIEFKQTLRERMFSR